MHILFPWARAKGRTPILLHLLTALVLVLSAVQTTEPEPVVAATKSVFLPTAAHSTLSVAPPICPPTIDFGVTIQCSIDAAAELDTYTFVAAVDDKVNVRMVRTSSTLVPRINLLGPSGVSVCSNGANLIAEISSCTLDSAGTYSLHVDDNTRSQTGTYTLALQRLNQPGNAQAIAFGQTLVGSIDAIAERDAYTFTAASDDKVRVRMARTSGALVPRINLVGSNGVSVCSNGANVIAEITSCTITSAGTYSLFVDDNTRNQIGGYTLYLQRLNQPGNAQAIAFGQTRVGSIDAIAELDTFTFVAQGDDKVIVRMTRTSGALVPRINLIGPNGVSICSNGANVIAEITSCTIASAGIYSLFVDDNTRNQIGAYTLFLQRLNKPGATPLIGNFGQTFAGSINAAAELDAFSFAAEVDDKVRIRMARTTGTLIPRINLFGPNGASVCSNGANVIAEITSCTLTSAGIYNIFVDDNSRTNTGNYTLYLQRLNKPGTAQPITFGQTQSGTIGALAELDAYTFVAGVDDKVRVRMTRTSNTLVPRIGLFNDKGIIVCSNANNVTAEIASCTLPSAGAYSLFVDDNSRTNTGNYTLSLECLNTSCATNPPPTCGLAPNGLDTCALEPGDILIQKWNSLENLAFMNIGGTYFTHAALYIGDGRIVEAIGAQFATADQVIERSLSAGGWTNAAIYDWVVIRPTTTTAVKQSAVAYARAKAVDPNVTYNILADKNSEQQFYCSQLIWKAYKQAGIDLEVDRGGSLTDIVSFNRLVTPDDLFYSSGLLAHRSVREQSKASSVDRALWRWTLWILSPAHIMIVDSQGRRSGFDTATGTVADDIPGVIYSGPNATVETLSVTDPTSLGADWHLVVTGFGAGTYHVEAGSVDNENPPRQILAGSTQPSKVENFTIPNPNATGTIGVGQKSIYVPVIRR